MLHDNPFFPRAFRLKRDERVSLDTPLELPMDRLVQVGSGGERPLFLGFGFSRRRFLVMASIFILLLSVLIGRAVWMQVWQGAKYEALSEQNRLRVVPAWPKRGIITDRNGVVLAENIPRFQVVLTPRDLPLDVETRTAMLRDLVQMIGGSFTEMVALLEETKARPDEPVLIADGVAYEQAMALALKLPELPAVSLEARPKRAYPRSAELTSLAHVLGYVGKISEQELGSLREKGYRRVDELGKVGIERSYEERLRGTVGHRTLEVDARGRAKGVVREEPSVNGQNVQLTIDMRLQKAAEQALSLVLHQEKLRRGSVVAMDPRNGEIRALVSLPAYDNNAFSGGVSSTVYQALVQDKDQPLFARALAGAYPSGSTVKIVVSVAALMEGIITPNTTILSTGGIRVGQWFFPDWKAGGHGITNVRKAIAWSINTFFYTIGGGYQGFKGMGPDALSTWYTKFGLGKKTGIDITGEASGLVPTQTWKEATKKEPWYVGDTYNLSIGQGDLLVTPLQVARYTMAIANGGTLIEPHLFLEKVPTRIETGARADVVEEVRQGMRDAVVSGSARGISLLPFTSGGKTGTAQWNTNNATHAWFTAFAPFENPELVVTVLLEEGGEGSRVAVPVAREILRAWGEMR